MKVSILIPVYNKFREIKDTKNTVYSHMKSLNKEFEVIIINDGSTDNSLNIIKEKKKEFPNLIILENSINKGKGYSIRKGILAASGDSILFLDADLAIPIQEINKTINEIKEFNIVIGSRKIKGANIKHEEPWIREFSSKAFSFIVSSLIIKNISDTQCGFKMYQSNCAKKIASFQTIDRWAFDVEHLFLASKMNLKVKEVPVNCILEDNSTLKVFPDSFFMLKDILKIRLNNILGYYKI
jgi:dolichyl-phosphate beta-glucosyltransferase